ncbi:peptidoglycan DD-metalloendopeptidase family protein [soil metagenome]
MKAAPKFLLALAASALVLGACPVSHAQKITERTRQKQLVEAERAGLQQQLGELKREIGRTEAAKSHAADALAHSEAAISEANRALHELASEQLGTEARLNELAKQQAELAKTVSAQQKRLAKILREQYEAGNEDRIKLLLSGDNPNRISRDLQYMAYVSQAQARMVESLRANLQAVETNQAQTQNAKTELDEIAAESRQQKAVLESEQARRTRLLGQLSDKLASQRKQAGNIERDELRLASLVDKLAKVIEEQRKAEAAANEKRRQEQAQAKAERARQRAELANKKKNAPASGKKANPDAIDDDEAPPKTAGKIEPRPPADAPIADGGNGLAGLRGQLRFPLRGDLVAKFGSKRGDGPSWKGLFIRAAEGAEVKSVAAGRIVFAEWLRGFGNLIIVDHGAQYMTIYGNNQAVLKRAGDAVKAGDVIASAGNSGGNEQSGLYFEMRHEGRAFDPLAWLAPGGK